MPFSAPVVWFLKSTRSPADSAMPSIDAPGDATVRFATLATRHESFHARPSTSASTYAFVAASCAADGSSSPTTRPAALKSRSTRIFLVAMVGLSYWQRAVPAVAVLKLTVVWLTFGWVTAASISLPPASSSSTLGR